MGKRQIWKNSDALGKMNHLWGDEGPRSQAGRQDEQSHSSHPDTAAVSVTNGLPVC